MSAAATITQTTATLIAAKHGYKTEIRLQTSGCWDVRIYSATGEPGGYDRRRDVSSDNRPVQILRMVAAKVADLTYEQAAKLTLTQALEILI